MKRISYILLLSVMAISMFASVKAVGDFSMLRHETRVNFEIDFSNAHIHNMTEEEFADYEEDWYVDKPDIEERIIEYTNEKLGGLIIVGRYTNANYTILLTDIKITTNGTFTCKAKLLDSYGREIAVIKDLVGKGGRFGSKLNLIKDGAKSIGQKLGATLSNAIRKSKK